MATPDRTTPWIQRIAASRAVRSGYTSAVTHVVALIALALLVIPADAERRPRPIRIRFAPPAAEPGSDAGGQAVAVAPAAAPAAATQPQPPAEPPAEPAITAPAATAVATAATPTPPLVPIAEQPAATAAVARPASLSRPASPADAASDGGADPFADRRGDARGRAARERGGSAASEAAVDAGLAWLAAHQGADGSWRCDLSNCGCGGACRDPGTVTSTTAATGLALLPFLGAGHTQAEGEHREVVARALYYLVSRIRATPRGGDLAEGTMYGQGVATLALAEALGMTRDDMLSRPVADAVRFIVTAQDAYGGGWRYLPGQSGDTTVTAWQLAALKSAALAGVAVPTPTIDGVHRFLDRVQARGGEAYGYQGPQAQPSTSAVGLFCRIHTGWDREETLHKGLAALAKPGPDPQAVYANFYLAQALLQSNHAAWPKWNRRNRDALVAAQARAGHEQGSWFFADPDTAPGGRLAHTALAVLTLEIYYRLLPVYRPEAVERGW
ncbi:MAG: prenyltransferase/squalene oxidase repeat-containing protein [Planctomycetaceae bacterium]